MNIDLLVKNLENTITGKELLASTVTNATVRQFIQINIEELKRILNDAKAVQEQVKQLEADLDGFVHGSL
jgi:cell division septum initiation protein DivIVA